MRTLLAIILLGIVALSAPGCLSAAQRAELRNAAAAQATAADSAREVIAGLEAAVVDVGSGEAEVEVALVRNGVPEDARVRILEDVRSGVPAVEAIGESVRRFSGTADAYAASYAATMSRLAGAESNAEIAQVATDAGVTAISLLAPQFAAPAALIGAVLTGVFGRKMGVKAERKNTVAVVKAFEGAKLPSEDGVMRIDVDTLATAQDAAGIRGTVALARVANG